jgi:leucyl-tRNA synthetase
VFDYIFYGKGETENICKTSDIPADILEDMRNEFLYWYPFDLRVSAKELVPNHLSFCIFHHAALFPREHWPRAMGVNGMLMIEGKQMHKSKGNFITMKNAVDKYGADATRCALLLGAEAMDDPDWRADNAADIQGKLLSLRKLALAIIEKAKSSEAGHLEAWLLSKIQQRIEEVTRNLDELKTRSSLEIALFEVWNDFRWYAHRKGETEAAAVKEALEVWLRLLAPFAPHICEELWSAAGKETFISLAEWPRVDEEKVDLLAEERENLLNELIDDTSNVLRATKISPKRVCYYTANSWKRQVYHSILVKSVQGEVKVNEVMKELSKDSSLRQNMKAVAGFVPKVIKTLSRMPSERKERLAKIEIAGEKEFIESALGFLEGRFDAEVAVYSEEDPARFDPKHRAALAVPGQPAIYIE